MRCPEARRCSSCAAVPIPGAVSCWTVTSRPCGRHPQSDIFLDDVTVSRRHVEFRRGPDGSFTVGDVGSLNGTYVNRERIDSVLLSNGDEVQIGKYRLVFYASPRGV